MIWIVNQLPKSLGYGYPRCRLPKMVSTHLCVSLHELAGRDFPNATTRTLHPLQQGDSIILGGMPSWTWCCNEVRTGSHRFSIGWPDWIWRRFACSMWAGTGRLRRLVVSEVTARKEAPHIFCWLQVLALCQSPFGHPLPAFASLSACMTRSSVT